jgi:hypothetical protein
VPGFPTAGDSENRRIEQAGRKGASASAACAGYSSNTKTPCGTPDKLPKKSHRDLWAVVEFVAVKAPKSHKDQQGSEIYGKQFNRKHLFPTDFNNPQ